MGVRGLFLYRALRFMPLADTTRRSAATANAVVLSSFGKNGKDDPNAQLKIGGVGMTSVQGTGQTGVRTSAFKKAVLGNAKNAISFPREGMSTVRASNPLGSIRIPLARSPSLLRECCLSCWKQYWGGAQFLRVAVAERCQQTLRLQAVKGSLSISCVRSVYGSGTALCSSAASRCRFSLFSCRQGH